MNEQANKLLADVRELVTELHDGELTTLDVPRLQMMVDVLRQIRADGVPDYPIVEYVKSRHSVERDNDGQSVIYLDDGPDTFNVCTICDGDYDTDDSDVDDVCPECWV
jgi:hypothetical protein